MFIYFFNATIKIYFQGALLDTYIYLYAFLKIFLKFLKILNL